MISSRCFLLFLDARIFKNVYSILLFDQLTSLFPYFYTKIGLIKNFVNAMIYNRYKFIEKWCKTESKQLPRSENWCPQVNWICLSG